MPIPMRPVCLPSHPHMVSPQSNGMKNTPTLITALLLAPHTA